MRASLNNPENITYILRSISTSISHLFLASKPKSCRRLVFPQNATVKWLSLQFLIVEVLDSNLGTESSYPEWVFHSFPPHSHSRLILGQYLKSDRVSSFHDLRSLITTASLMLYKYVVIKTRYIT
jgi:hypothetical protein